MDTEEWMRAPERVKRAILAYEYVGMAAHGMSKAFGVLNEGEPDEDELQQRCGVMLVELSALQNGLEFLLRRLREEGI